MEDKSSAKPRGRQPSHLYEDYRTLFPAKDTPGLTTNELHRALIRNGEIKPKMIHQVCKRWAEEGHVEIIDVQGQPRRYRSCL